MNPKTIPDRDLEDTREPEEEPEYTKEEEFYDAADYYFEMDGDR